MRKYIKAQQSLGKAVLINPSTTSGGAATVGTRCSGTEMIVTITSVSEIINEVHEEIKVAKEKLFRIEKHIHSK